jgi:orotidine-5'-phosphate decarboxylase
VESAAELGVHMLTVHLSGGDTMVRAATNAGKDKLSILGVTVLTSNDDQMLHRIGIKSDVPEQVLRLAKLGENAGVDGFVASPQEAAMLRQEFGAEMKIVVPGIRPSWSDPGDQRRVMTPREAMAAGADYLVIGRPVISHPNPREALAKILEELSD